MEIRLKNIQLDFDKEQRKLGGYINVCERESETMYSHQRNKWFKETIKAGTFTRALQKNDSIPLLLEHDWDKQLAHTSNGTLELREDSIGLRFDAIVSEEAYEDIKSRNITSCSFGFKSNEEVYENVNPKLEKRYISNIDLFEVSLVANPAYTGSLVEERNLEQALKELEDTTVETEEKTTTETVEEIREKVEEIREKVEDAMVGEVVEKTLETNTTVEENAIVGETTQEEVVAEQEVLSTVDVEEERAIDVDVTSSEVKEDAKEVIEEVIEKTKADAEFYSEMAKSVDDYKEEVVQEKEKIIENLENESLHYTTLAYTKWLEVARLKQINMNL